MTDINEIQARISKYGISRPNRFQIVFSTPEGLLSLIDSKTAERLIIQCEGASLPGKSFSTFDHRIYGPLVKMPYVATFASTIDITFRVGTDLTERSLFDAWHELIMDPKTNMFNYMKHYETEIVVHQLDMEDNRIYSVKLIKAYPSAIGPINLSSTSRDSYSTQSITFAYKQWETTDEEPVTLESTTTVKKAESGFVETYLLRGAGAFFDQLPRITGSGGTLFGSTFNRSF